jgi:hypothetical protein
MSTFRLNGELGSQLIVEIVDYEQQLTSDVHDANWLACSAQVEQGAFRGRVEAAMQTTDFAILLSELGQVLEGQMQTASFNTMEGWLEFKINVDRAGRADVAGTLRDVQSVRAELSFHFQSDLTYLAKAHAELKRLVAAYPYRSVSG